MYSWRKRGISLRGIGIISSLSESEAIKRGNQVKVTDDQFESDDVMAHSKGIQAVYVDEKHTSGQWTDGISQSMEK